LWNNFSLIFEVVYPLNWTHASRSGTTSSLETITSRRQYVHSAWALQLGMTQHTDKESELQAPDPAAAAFAPTNGERHEDAGFVTPVQDVDLSKTIDEKIQPFAADYNVQDDENAVLAQTRSHATSASVATTKQEKPWYKTWNPLRWGAIPPIPKEPIVSREAKAGLWSKLTFSWMGPIMTVSPCS
jgi:hypothetical protein